MSALLAGIQEMHENEHFLRAVLSQMILGNHWTNDFFLPSPQVRPLRDTCFTLVTEISTGFISRQIWLDFVLLINFLPFPVSPFQAPSHCFLGVADEQSLRFWFNVSLLMKNGSLLPIKLAAGGWVKKLEPNNGSHWVYLIHGFERCAQEEGENSKRQEFETWCFIAMRPSMSMGTGKKF